MLGSNIPVKWTHLWAQNAASNYINYPIPDAPSHGNASQQLGWPPETATDVALGGNPPTIRDDNGINRYFSEWVRWFQTGAPVSYDATHAANIGGYPRGTILQSATNPGWQWASTVDSNASNPDTGGANWVHYPYSLYAVDTGLQNAVVATLSPAPTSLASLIGVPIYIKVSNTNSANVTLALNGFTATAVTGANGQPLASSMLSSGGIYQLLYDGTKFQCVSHMVTTLTSPLVLNVSNAGNDTTGSGSLANPFATIQRAWNFLTFNFNVNGQNVQIKCADGTYSAASGAVLAASGNPAGANGPIALVGNPSAPLNCKIIMSGTGVCISTVATALSVNSFYLQSNGSNPTGAQGCALSAQSGGIIIGTGLVFGAFTGYAIQASTGSQIVLTPGQYYFTGPTGGGGAGAYGFARGHACGTVTINSIQLNIFYDGTGQSTSISGAFLVSDECGIVEAQGMGFTGAFIGGGYQFIVQTNGVLISGGGYTSYPNPGASGGNVSGGGAVQQTGGQFN